MIQFHYVHVSMSTKNNGILSYLQFCGVHRQYAIWIRSTEQLNKILRFRIWRSVDRASWYICVIRTDMMHNGPYYANAIQKYTLRSTVKLTIARSIPCTDITQNFITCSQVPSWTPSPVNWNQFTSYVVKAFTTYSLRATFYAHLSFKICPNKSFIYPNECTSKMFQKN